jgi:3-phosphoshikimate 1-carboxyvinyltransferase
MKVRLSYLRSSSDQYNSVINISGSKSESNRFLILQKLFPEIQLKNLSNSNDTLLLIDGLSSNNNEIDVGHAGTTMRFLTAYYSTMIGRLINLKGSDRMHVRPIGVMVNALRDLGADIQYLNAEGFPPIKIKGTNLKGGRITMDAGISSQFISALMLIAPSLSNELTIDLTGEIASRSYIELTKGVLNKIGVDCRFEDNMISIKPFSLDEKITIEIESDWSSASYWYSIVAMSDRLSISLRLFRSSSLQGDSIVTSIFKKLGVSTTFNSSDSSIRISKISNVLPDIIQFDLKETPDLAQTLAVTCFGLGVECVLLGLETLQIKETDRLTALKNELEKLGASVVIDSNSIRVIPTGKYNKDAEIRTYDDHRMALSFASLAIMNPITIDSPDVVSKSYPSFWDDLEKIGFSLSFE